MILPDIETQHSLSDGVVDGRNPIVQDGGTHSAKADRTSSPLGTEKANCSDASIHESGKRDNRPRHASTGRPLSLPREIAVVTVVCLAQLMTQAGVGQGTEHPNVPLIIFPNPTPQLLPSLTSRATALVSWI